MSVIFKAHRSKLIAATPMHWKIILTYDGTPYNGWQIQPNIPTIQGKLSETIHHITGETVLPQGSGRTDTGVHALAQVATFSLNAPIPAANLHRALNRALPPSIRVLSVESVSEDFHARHSAQRKTYEYRILPCDNETRICPPMLAPYVWPCRYPLDLAILQQAATHIVGTYDFTSFAANDPDQATRTASDLLNARTNAVISTEAADSLTVGREVERPQHFALGNTDADSPIDDTTNSTSFTRTIYHSAWHQQNDLLIYRITGNGFLHHMVRNLVGTFVEAAANRISADAIPKILAARNRSAAGPTAPPSGLFLVEVEYE